MANWIFGSKTTPEIFEKRISGKKWPIFKHTPNKMKLKNGDKVIFYKAGKDGQKFIGTASIGSEIVPDNLDYYVTLYDVQVWKKPIGVPSILNEIQFIKNKSNWGLYFQGGVSHLPDADYHLIVSKSKETLKKK